MNEKTITLSSEGELVLESADGKIEKIESSCMAFTYIVLDCSGSMSGKDKLVQAKKGAINFAKDAIKKGYRVGLIEFESDVKHICGPQSDISVLNHLINKINTGCSTNMTDAILLATQKLLKKEGKLYMVIVTDGKPDSPNSALDAGLKAKARGINIITIGTDDAEREFLKKLASEENLSMKVNIEELAHSIATASKLLLE